MLRGLYAAALCLCVTSLCEGFCLPILEAQRLDCPVVFADRSVMPEVAGSGGVPYDGSIADLGMCISCLIDQPARRSELIRLGRVNSGCFSWSEAAKKYESVIDRSLGAG